MIEINKIHQGDCLELMKKVDDKSVDMILCDLPYGVTQNEADKVIDLNKLWEQYKRIIKDDGTIILTAQQPFTTDLINSNRGMFKYELIWHKELPSGFLNANRQPLRVHENILVFYKNLGTYNPQKVKGEKNHSKGSMKTDVNNNYGKYGKVDNSEEQGDMKHPQSIISFMKPHPSKAEHPTEKPVELAEWIIKSYSKEGDLILDNCIGTGWTAIACKMLGRNFIGMDLNKEYILIAEDRLNKSYSGRADKLSQTTEGKLIVGSSSVPNQQNSFEGSIDKNSHILISEEVKQEAMQSEARHSSQA